MRAEAFTPRPFHLPLFTQVRGRRILRSSCRRSSPKFAEPAFSEVRCLQATPSPDEEMATWRIDMPCSRIDTYDAIASRGGGSSPFFLRPTKEGYMYMSKRLALVLAGAVMAALMVAMTGVASAQDVVGCKGDIVLDPGHGGTDP